MEVLYIESRGSMQSTIDLWVIKGSSKETLRDHLMSYKKETLFQLAVQHQVDVRKSYTKAKITALLVPQIIQHFLMEWDEFTPSEKEHFIRMKKAEEVDFNQVQEWVEKGYLFLYLNREQLTVEMPKEWGEELTQSTNESPSSTMDDFSAFYNNAVTFKQIFGYINVGYLVTVWNRYYETTVEIEEARRMLMEKNILS